MPYIDIEYFNTNSDLTIGDAELTILIDRASEIINSLTMDLQGRALEALPLLSQDKVKLATMAQVETLFHAGGTESLFGGDLPSATIGKFSYSSDSGSDKIPISPMVRLYLSNTGLLYRGLC